MACHILVLVRERELARTFVCSHELCVGAGSRTCPQSCVTISSQVLSSSDVLPWSRFQPCSKELRFHPISFTLVHPTFSYHLQLFDKLIRYFLESFDASSQRCPLHRSFSQKSIQFFYKVNWQDAKYVSVHCSSYLKKYSEFDYIGSILSSTCYFSYDPYSVFQVNNLSDFFANHLDGFPDRLIFILGWQHPNH